MLHKTKSFYQRARNQSPDLPMHPIPQGDHPILLQQLITLQHINQLLEIAEEASPSPQGENIEWANKI